MNSKDLFEYHIDKALREDPSHFGKRVVMDAFEKTLQLAKNNEVLDLVSYRYLDDGETAEIGDEYYFNDEWIPVEKQYFPYVFRTRGFYKHRRKI